MASSQFKKMHTEPMIFALDGQGGASEVKVDTDALSSKTLYWIQVPLVRAKKYLAQLNCMPAWAIEVLCVRETRPRTMVYDDALIGIFRGINVNPNQDPEDMVSVRVWIKGNLIITIQNHFLVTTNELEQSLLQGAGPKNTSEFLVVCLRTLIDKSSDAISVLDDQLDALEDRLADNLTIASGRPVLNEMRRRVILLKRYLLPQRDAILRIGIDPIVWLEELDRYRIREVADACTRLLEDLDAEKERSNVMHEEMFAQAQESMNQKIYLLTIVAAIFMPLSFITGLLGINVGGIPGSTFKYAFAIVCGLLVAISCLQFWLLKRKRWV